MDLLLTTHSSLKSTGIQHWVHHTWIKQALPEENSDLTAAVETAREAWTCIPEGDIKFLFQRETAPALSIMDRTTSQDINK